MFHTIMQWLDATRTAFDEAVQDAFSRSMDESCFQKIDGILKSVQQSCDDAQDKENDIRRKTEELRSLTW